MRTMVSGRNTMWALVAEAAKLFTAIGTFLLLTGILDPSEYGVYVGTLGLMWFVLPFASFGAPYLLLQRVAGDGEDIDTALRRGNGTVAFGGAVAIVLLVLFQPVVLPQSPVLVLLLLAASEIVFGGIHEVTVFGCQALEKLRLSAVIRLLQGVTRFGAALVLVVAHSSATLTEWAWLHMAAAALAAIVGLRLLSSRPRLGVPRWADLRSGFGFSVGFGADKLRESADTTLLLRVGTSTDAGLYGAALRLINLAVVPLRALIASSNARFFVAGAVSAGAARAVARRITLIGAVYSVAALGMVVLLGPVAVSFMSDEYATAGDALRLLAAWPLAVSLEAFVATALTATGNQRARVLSIVVSTSVVVALNLALIPGHGWHGAVIASYAGSTLNAGLLWIFLAVVVRHRMKREADPTATSDEHVSGSAAR